MGKQDSEFGQMQPIYPPPDLDCKNVRICAWTFCTEMPCPGVANNQWLPVDWGHHTP